jgi:hypothetical protein
VQKGALVHVIDVIRGSPDARDPWPCGLKSLQSRVVRLVNARAQWGKPSERILGTRRWWTPVDALYRDSLSLELVTEQRDALARDVK